MIELEWLDGWTGETTDELLALAGTVRTDSLVLAFEQALRAKASRVGEDRLTVAERTVLAIEALEREVNNGGYEQFLRNESRRYAPTIVDALRRIECPETAALTQRAIDLLAIEGPLIVEAIDAALARDGATREDDMHACTRRYFTVAGDLAEPLLAFIQRHRDRIAPVP